jgi:hypothetical protein
MPNSTPRNGRQASSGLLKVTLLLAIAGSGAVPAQTASATDIAADMARLLHVYQNHLYGIDGPNTRAFD